MLPLQPVQTALGPLPERIAHGSLADPAIPSTPRFQLALGELKKLWKLLVTRLVGELAVAAGEPVAIAAADRSNPQPMPASAVTRASATAAGPGHRGVVSLSLSPATPSCPASLWVRHRVWGAKRCSDDPDLPVSESEAAPAARRPDPRAVPGGHRHRFTGEGLLCQGGIGIGLDQRSGRRLHPLGHQPTPQRQLDNGFGSSPDRARLAARQSILGRGHWGRTSRPGPRRPTHGRR